MTDFLKNAPTLLTVMVACLALPSASTAAEDVRNFAVNGSFERPASGGNWPEGWSKPEQGGSWGEENDNRFLRIRAMQPDVMTSAYQAVPLDGAPKEALEISCRMRAGDLKTGSESWHDARLILNFILANGEKRSALADPPHLNEAGANWTEQTVWCAVPPEARTVEIIPALFHVAYGTLDVDDITIREISLATLKAATPPFQQRP